MSKKSTTQWAMQRAVRKLGFELNHTEYRLLMSLSFHVNDDGLMRMTMEELQDERLFWPDLDDATWRINRLFSPTLRIRLTQSDVTAWVRP